MVDKLGSITQLLERDSFNTLHRYKLRVYPINYDIPCVVWSTYYQHKEALKETENAMSSQTARG